MYLEHQEGLHSRSQRFAEAQFADLEHSCSATEDFALNALSFLLAISPVLVIIGFALS